MGGRRFSDEERGEAYRLWKDESLSGREIARRMGRDVHTICNYLQTFRDSRQEATDYLRAQAVKMAENVVEHGTPADHIKVLKNKNLAVLAPEEEMGVGGGLIVVLQAGHRPPTDAELLEAKRMALPPMPEPPDAA